MSRATLFLVISTDLRPLAGLDDIKQFGLELGDERGQCHPALQSNDLTDSL